MYFFETNFFFSLLSCLKLHFCALKSFFLHLATSFSSIKYFRKHSSNLKRRVFLMVLWYYLSFILKILELNFFLKICFFLNGNFGKPLKTPLISEFLKQKSFGSIYIYIRLLCSYLLLTSTVSVIAFFIFWEFRRHISVRILRFLCSHSCSTCWHQFRLVGLIFTQIPWAHKYLETSSCQQKNVDFRDFQHKIQLPTDWKSSIWSIFGIF